MVAKTISLFSAPFYTGHYGYKMCLLFYMNGDGSVKGTHLSPFSPSIGGVSTMHSGRFRKSATDALPLQASSYNGTFHTEKEAWSKTISLYSFLFYTGRYGYKICLRLYMNGDGSGKGTHLYFFLTITWGECDALLM